MLRDNFYLRVSQLLVLGLENLLLGGRSICRYQTAISTYVELAPLYNNHSR